ncbi:MAG: 30S ribosomal protein S6 [Planctomycetes bacterium RIFCSPHIGHO2_12_FULL_51_37]|nr:MAG: 30S ribosomal protein S6 [Planctomycetes bacterium RIFCSPHIGHO2_12_FULL_51_37]
MFLLDNTKAGDWDSVVGQVQGILKRRNAQVTSVEKWGERKLAYPVKGHRRGTYMQVYFEAPAGIISDIRRDCQLSDAILRCLILKVEKRPETAVQQDIQQSPSSTRIEEAIPPERSKGDSL